MSFLKSSSFRIILAIISVLFFHEYISSRIQSFIYSISLLLKDIMRVCVPFIIFHSVYFCFRKLDSKEGIRFITLLLLCIILSNFLSIFTSVFTSAIALKFTAITCCDSQISISDKTIKQLFVLGIPTFPLYLNVVVFVFSAFLGLIINIHDSCYRYTVDKIASVIRIAVKFLINYVILPLIPIFIAGFIFKILQDKGLQNTLRSYPVNLTISICLMFIYLGIMFIIAALAATNRSAKQIAITLIKPTITGFSTMSSTIALPLSIEAVEQNVLNKENGKAAITIATTVHTIGESILIPFLAILVHQSASVSLSTYEILMLLLIVNIAKFSGSGIPSGGIFIIAPMLGEYLHFTPEALGIMTAIYIVMDSIGTAGNVIGNNLFAIIFDRIYLKVLKRNTSKLPK
ncbi:putative sodium:dicarboxylate symporter family protein [Candidatus Fokinia solitaria]|uniref:Putative sodium:dicarboxylate symporter family protein n=1 Tax=Candidatus Fokinia solitaria TaxID=1802984 RepID=A0A2U8BRJ5_9RICK|nr:cation:dicarboxylase symporter family transporter [Candidatus Fokinia solitaria]AWD32962.1 putative sodium:dicarboxylate symporter family protein [Candidatus Fokinia solitaria]